MAFFSALLVQSSHAHLTMWKIRTVGYCLTALLAKRNNQNMENRENRVIVSRICRPAVWKCWPYWVQNKPSIVPRAVVYTELQQKKGELK